MNRRRRSAGKGTMAAPFAGRDTFAIRSARIVFALSLRRPDGAVLLSLNPGQECRFSSANQGAKVKHRQSPGFGEVINLPTLGSITKNKFSDLIRAAQEIGCNR